MHVCTCYVMRVCCARVPLRPVCEAHMEGHHQLVKLSSRAHSLGPFEGRETGLITSCRGPYMGCSPGREPVPQGGPGSAR